MTLQEANDWLNYCEDIGVSLKEEVLTMTDDELIKYAQDLFNQAEYESNMTDEYDLMREN